MSNEDNLHGLEDLDDTRVSADELRAMPMSVPPVKRDKREAKFKLSDVPRQAPQSIKVYDRYGVEHKDIIEFDPETFQGKRWNDKDKKTEDCFFYNGYVVADGLAHPDEEQYPEIVENVRREVITKGRVSGSGGLRSLGPNPSLSDFGPERTVDVSTKQRDQTGLKCPKCQSMLRLNEIIENDGEVKQGIFCSNGNCGMKWQQSNAGVGKG